MILYNPKAGASIKNFPWKRKLYDLSRNEMKEFSDEVAKQLKDTYKFLQRVEPENVVDIKEQMKEFEFKCEFCDAEFDTEKKLRGHMLGKHKMSEEAKKALKDIKKEEGKDLGGRSPEGRNVSEENKEGIPTGNATDRDGVSWYGPGLTTDSGMRSKTPSNGYFD